MVRLPFQRILALSAHTDDIEFGCGASLHRLIAEGAEIFEAVFSTCEESVPAGFPPDILEKEMYQAAGKLNIKKDNIRLFQYPVRKFPEHRQDILEDMVRLSREIRPDLIFTPSGFDVHQDHQTIHHESIRAFRYRSLFGYELPWNNIRFEATGLIEVSEADVDAKTAAIACYRSQEFRHYTGKDYFMQHARLRGIQSRKELAEAFQVIRLSL